MKAVYNGKEADIEITDKAVIIDTGSDIVGFDIQAIRTVRKRDTGEIVIAYSTGAKVESITIKPLNDSDRANLILALTQKEGGTAQKVVPDTVLDEEFERIYRNLKEKGESNIKLYLEGREFEKFGIDEINNAYNTMKDILMRKYGVDILHPPWYIRDKPYEAQVGYAKFYYLGFLHQILKFLAGVGSLFDENTRSFSKLAFVDDWGFTIDDYIRYFRHYGIDVIELPEKLKEELEKSIVSNVEIYEEEDDGVGPEEGYPRPPDYKSWF